MGSIPIAVSYENDKYYLLRLQCAFIQKTELFGSYKMSKKGFTANGVPHYAHPDTPGRPDPARFVIRKIPENILEGKISRSEAWRYVHNYINENFHHGDQIIISDRVIEEKGQCRFAGLTGTFDRKDTKANMIRIDWDDGKHYLMGIMEFYYYAYHISDDGVRSQFTRMRTE